MELCPYVRFGDMLILLHQALMPTCTQLHLVCSLNAGYCMPEYFDMLAKNGQEGSQRGGEQGGGRACNKFGDTVCLWSSPGSWTPGLTAFSTA